MDTSETVRYVHPGIATQANMKIAPNDTDLIEGAQLTGWSVLAAGTRVGMDIVGADGALNRIVLPFEMLGSLLMTLPRMLQAALNARFPDGSLRFVQRLGTWRIEHAEANTGLILRLTTQDGFEVAFVLGDHDADALGTALTAAPNLEPSDVRRPN
jgi:hypothetical protein